MTQSLIPVILAGGKGERFWPLSRRHRPKQFLCLDGSDRSLLQATADRLLPMAGGWDQLWVITSALVADGVREQLPELPEANLLVEPEGRDTAPAVAWATLEIAKRYGEEALIGFFPADHWIGDQAKYQQTLAAAGALATSQAAIVTLGIQPGYASTGYGYIEQGDRAGTHGDLAVFKVSRFTEKPDAATAQEFINTGRFSWNSGMFIFRAAVVLAELAQHAPEILEPLRSQGKAAYGTLDKKSIDYALMEKTQLAYVLPADFGWDDLGDWNALERLNEKQGENVVIGQHLGADTTGAIIYNSSPDEVVVTIGLEDVVVVRDRNATLIVHKSRTQDIKAMLKQMQGNPTLETLL
ncbi:mannose-1-phosphate guanylyltransferase [Spirulina major]|uniref:mannose-1-phosphate guanylyltransferase n=1 Tax=Spirulina major TaxID=270636 RepID=UPI0009328F25|nr:mannose-1-phosphate guanylyltransferase [Spirulina major]